MKVFIVIAFTSLLLVGLQKKQIEWRTLVPLVTTRNEVEAQLGAPSSGKEYVWIYDTTEERITVWYGGGKSSGADGCRWDTPKETVFNFLLAPKKKVRLADLNIDLAKYRKQKALEMVQDYYYYNENEGITITTRMAEGEEILLSIERGPDAAQRKKYCCKEGQGC
ncbi:MAG TPA: hypothetical protein VFX63_18310 [Pyrinomonadaceae bacterium]|nr:hypothetical protein [Pyrinomonadaceae bacterium]